MTWHVLDVGSIWMKEFASALSRIQPVVAWNPRMLATGTLQEWQRPRTIENPPLSLVDYPLQRGYARPPLNWLLPYQHRLRRRLLARTTGDPAHAPLICTTPFYAPLAELWPGPVIYYSTDLTVAYEGLNPRQVTQLETRLCRVAALICPNSRRIAEHLTRNVGCEPAHIAIIPNATRAFNIASSPGSGPGPLPPDVAALPRPVVGVLGDLSGNMDWELLAESIRLTPALSWLFVGPTDRPIAGAAQRAARSWCIAHAKFAGPKPYSELQEYARSLDVAILPYLKKEPTWSGSSTRFYEHLAALRPMIATRGFAELLEKPPLLQLIDTASQLVAALDHLRANNFIDGNEQARWQASQYGTWENRAATMVQALSASVSPSSH